MPRRHFHLPFFSLMYSRQSIFQDQIELDVCTRQNEFQVRLRDEGKKYDICRPCGIRTQWNCSTSATKRIEIIWINKMQLCELRFLMSKSIWINYGLNLSNFFALIVCSEFYFVVRFRAGDVSKKSELFWWKWEPSRRRTMSGEIIKLNWKFRIQNSTFVQSKTVQ